MKRFPHLLAGLVALACVGLATAAAPDKPTSARADAACPYGDGMYGGMYGWMDGYGMRGQPDGKNIGDLPAMIEKRLQWLKSELKITADQENAWLAFAGKYKQQGEAAQAMHEKFRQQQPPATPVSAPERMEKGVEFMKERLGHMEAMSTAVKDLYAVLTPEQKAIADKKLVRHPGAPRERMMRRGR